MFRRSLQRYGTTPEPETPYQRAGQVWDDRIGSARAQAKNWRLMAFGSAGVAAVLAVGLIWQSLQSRVVPYVVQVDRQGSVEALGPALKRYQPTDAQIAFFLSHFLTDVRSLSIDPVVVRNNWLEAYDYVTDHAAVSLSDYARSNDPFKAIGQRTVSVQITSVVRASDTSFQVKWTEQHFDHDALTGTERWTAILSVVSKEPANADVLRKNPLGLYVNAINWSRDLGAADSQ
jgi:type IV secretory pathway TrbF-like protein